MRNGLKHIFDIWVFFVAIFSFWDMVNFVLKIPSELRTYPQQTLRGILTGHSIHIHMYRIQVCQVVSCTQIDVYTIVTYTRAGLNAR